MKTMKKLPSTAILAMSITGCSSMLPPSENEMANLPRVEIGSGKPAAQEYVLHIPAHQSFPVKLVIDGKMLRKKAEADTQVSLRREIYLYKHWLSYDGKKWLPSDKEIDFAINMGLDGDGGNIHLAVD
jgi:hypothetical protein